MKIVCSDPKSGRSVNIEVPAERSALLLNKKIGDEIDGTVLGLAGYKMRITGGSDKSGFPMYNSIDGTRKTRVLMTRGRAGRDKGVQRRVSARGNTISADIEQVNAVVTEYGEKGADEVFPKKAPGEKKQEEAAEPKKEKK